jgi:phage baseplate assembly protein W
MPIPVVTRIDPRDLDKNRAVGISLPFNGGDVFNKTYATKDQIKSNLINLLLTHKGERPLNPKFGTNLLDLIFEPINNKIITDIQNQIIDNVRIYIPEITLTDIEVTPDTDYNKIYVAVSYFLNLSGDKNKIIIDFSTLQ